MDRQDFMDFIHAELTDDPDNNRANRIIDAADEYVEYSLAKQSAQHEPISDAYMKAVWTWLLDYQIKAAELKGRYTPYEVLSWVANDWRKEHDMPPAQPEPCEDAVSREMLVNFIKNASVWVTYKKGDSEDESEFAENIIKQTKQAIISMIEFDLPPVTPKQRTGH